MNRFRTAITVNYIIWLTNLLLVKNHANTVMQTLSKIFTNNRKIIINRLFIICNISIVISSQ